MTNAAFSEGPGTAERPVHAWPKACWLHRNRAHRDWLQGSEACARGSRSRAWLEQTQSHYFQKSKKTYTRLLEGIAHHNLHDVVENVVLETDEWKEVLALLFTHGDKTNKTGRRRSVAVDNQESLKRLIGMLGDRLSGGKNGKFLTKEMIENRTFAAVLCYLSSGDLKKVMSIWSKSPILSTPATKTKKCTGQEYLNRMLALQSLVEKVSLFRKVLKYDDTDLDLSMQEIKDGDEVPEFALAGLYDRYVEVKKHLIIFYLYFFI